MVKNEIKVFARLKPEVKRKNIVNYEIHRRPKKHIEEDYLVLNVERKSINEYINNRPESWNFGFYKIFDNDIKQDEIFENVAQPVVQSVLNGYNATIFAYGQTGSGKTFSITGDPERYEDRGVLPRTIQYLFHTIQKNPDNLYSVEIAYLEIYNENGYDLLDPRHEVISKLEDLPRVTIQEDETGKLHLKNLSFRNVENEKDALAILYLGDTNRAISETPMNPQSSRSHCIFTIAVSVKQSGAQHLTKAKMHLVDLAGSERVYKCCISGTILTEAKYINLSLHYLEQVIVCLGQQNVNHIPYRNSLLTAILRDSLGGNCLTTMLATLSLNTFNLEETISTCRFSQRVALIKNDVNLIFERNPEDENRFLKMEIERLRNQIAQLTKQPIINGELTPSEKQDLNYKVSKFLESDETINWNNDERKIQYCLGIIRENFMIRKGKKHCVEESEQDLNYYRNLVVQRDKEISALINMLKKSKRNSPNNSSNDSAGLLKALGNQNDTSPRISIIAKKVRLRDLMMEAKSIAELIKNGKASIGDLKTRMSNDKHPVEIQPLNETLQVEQSRLAHNLSLLKTLKSQANYLKASSIVEGECSKNFDTKLSEESVKIASLRRKEAKNPSENIDQGGDMKKVLFTSLVKEEKSNNNSGQVPSPENMINDADVERNASRSEESKTMTLVNLNLKNSCNHIGTQLSLTGERFDKSKSLPNGESRRSSSRAPEFLGDMFRSNGDYVLPGLRSPPLERSCDLNLNDIEIKVLTEMAQSSQTNFSISESNSVQKSMINSSKYNSTNVESNVTEYFNGYNTDSRVYENDETTLEYKLRCEQSDKFHEALSTVQKYLKEDSNRVEQPIFIPDENRESNTIQDDSIAREDDSFMKSLPLTGDSEIDEEIIAFYRAKISGGTY